MAYIPSIKRNLISVPILNILGYSFLFGIGKAKLYQDSLLIGIEVLCGKSLHIRAVYFALCFCYPYVNTVSSY